MNDPNTVRMIAGALPLRFPCGLPIAQGRGRDGGRLEVADDRSKLGPGNFYPLSCRSTVFARKPHLQDWTIML